MDPVLLAKAIIQTRQFDREIHQTAEMLKQSADDIIEGFNKSFEELAEKFLHVLLLTAPETHPLKILLRKADKKRQDAFLKALSEQLDTTELVSKTHESSEEAKTKVPSAEKMWNKKVEKLPGYAMYANNQTTHKSNSDPYSGMSDSEVRDAKQTEMRKSVKTRRQHLLERVEKSSSHSSFSPHLNPSTFTTLQKGNPDAFLEECIRQRMAEEGTSESEAREWCRQFMEQNLGVSMEPNEEEDRRRLLDSQKRQRLPSATEIFHKLNRKNKHWLEGASLYNAAKQKTETTQGEAQP